MAPPRLPIRMATPVIGEEERALVDDCVRQGWISSQGSYVPRFEGAFASYVDASNGVAVCNGTVALSLALMALRLRPGDEVIVPSLTFGATANAVALAGGVPVFVTSDARYWQMDPDDVSAAVTGRTKGIIAVHLYGHPVDLDPVMATAREHGLWVIEDAAEAHGAEYRGRRVGALADVGTFSFYANKVITTGEGGMCVTNDDALAERLRMLRDHGMSKERRYWHEEVGSNFRMTNLQAAIGVAQMGRIDGLVARKREVAAAYRSALSGLEELGAVLQDEAPWARSVWWMFNVLLPEGVERERVAAAMAERQVATRSFFHPLHTMPAFRDYPASGAVRGVEAIAARGLTLPSGAELGPAEIAHVAEALTTAIAQPAPVGGG